jgi:hypothetical protein
MRSAAKVFYLAVFAFLRLANADSHGESSLHHGHDACAVSETLCILFAENKFCAF